MDGRGNEQRLGFSLSGEAVSVEWHIADLRTAALI